MFDIGFWELVTIAIIGIVVVGPEKLPEVVRTIMATVRKFRRMFDDVKGDIERELHLDDIRRQVQEADIQEHIRKLNQSVIDAGKEFHESGKDLLHDIDHAVNQIDSEESPNSEDPSENKEISSMHDTLPAADDFFAEPDPGQHADTGIEPPKNNTTP